MCAIEVAEQKKAVARWQLVNAQGAIALDVQKAFVEVLLTRFCLGGVDDRSAAAICVESKADCRRARHRAGWRRLVCLWETQDRSLSRHLRHASRGDLALSGARGGGGRTASYSSDRARAQQRAQRDRAALAHDLWPLDC